MFDYSKLYGKIREVFKNQISFAKAMGMSRSALNLRLTGGVEWKGSEMYKACKLLGVPLEEIKEYFFLAKKS